MAEISVIGSAWLEECIHCKAPSIHTGKNQASITRYFSGDMYNVAYNLALLDTQTSLCMKYGNDLESAELWNKLNSLNVMLYGPTVTEKLPTLVTVSSNSRTLKFWDDNDAFAFDIDDLYPHTAFAKSDFVVTDIRDNKILELLVNKSPKTKWVISRHVPTKEIMEHVEGIILTYEDALKLGKATDFDRICYRLCALGAKWVIIYMGKQGIYSYSAKKPLNYQCLFQGDGFDSGCYSGFISGFLYGLSTYYDLHKGIEYGNKTAAAIYNVVESTRDDLKDAITAYNEIETLIY